MDGPDFGSPTCSCYFLDLITHETQGMGSRQEISSWYQGFQEEAFLVIYSWWIYLLVSFIALRTSAKLKLIV